ncbi:Alpha/Beta hydrolase protein [Aspergillus heterothallicus]
MSTHKTTPLPTNSIAHTWSPVTGFPPRAILILQHGFGEYAERYTTSHARLIPSLTARNIEVWALDLEGHGQSPGKRGRGVVDVERAVQEHVWLCEHVAGVYNNSREARNGDTTATTRIPIILFGHSLGGLVTAASATSLLSSSQAYPNNSNRNTNPKSTVNLTGLLLTSPVFPLRGLTPFERVKSLVLNLLARASAALFPAREVPWPASEGNTLCGDPEQVKLAAEDEILVHGQISWTVAASAVSVVRGVWRGIRGGVWNTDSRPKDVDGEGNRSGKKVDVLVLHGRGDCWTDWQGSKSFIEGIQGSRGYVDVPEDEEGGSGAKLVVTESPYHELCLGSWWSGLRRGLEGTSTSPNPGEACERLLGTSTSNSN